MHNAAIVRAAMPFFFSLYARRFFGGILSV